MAAATFDIKSSIGKNRPQTPRNVEIPFRLDCADHFAAGIDAGESAALLTTPKGFVYLGLDCHLIVAEGAAGTIDIGTEADSDGMLDGGNANGTAGALIAKAGTESQAVGSYLSETEIRATIAGGQPTLDAAVIYGILRGYVIDQPDA